MAPACDAQRAPRRGCNKKDFAARKFRISNVKKVKQGRNANLYGSV